VLLAGAVFGATLVSVCLLFNERLLKSLFEHDMRRLDDIQDVIFILSFFVVVTAPATILGLRALSGGPQYMAYAARLTPLAVLLTLAAVEFIFYIVHQRREQGVLLFRKLDPPLWRIVILVLVSLLGIVVFVIQTGFGVTPDRNMGAPAIPLLEWQILLVVLVLVIFAFLPWRHLERWDRWFALAVYFFTVTLWLSQPINTAYTATPPRAPNFEIYPFSDPQIYSQYSQAALIGNGFLYPEVPSRALYVAFLTWAHLLGGQDYNTIIFLQTLLLALFPVSLYLIGRELGGRAVGFGLAAMPLFRDINSNIAVPFASNVTYSKLLLSELPLALALGFFILIVIHWLKYGQNSNSLPILAGGVIGVATLVRTQGVILVAVVAFIALMIMKDKKRWLLSIFLMGMSLTITIVPWLTRNYAATGGLITDNPISQVMTMARRWNGSWGNEVLPRLPGETDVQYSSRMTDIAVEAFKHNPQYILRTAANHFINSEIASLMVLPLRNEVRNPSEVLTPQLAFWSTTLKPHQLPLFSFYLLLFGLGLATAIRRLGWLGVLPLGSGVIYNIWTALFFSSGERFIVPLDWTVYFYQLFGGVMLGALVFGFTKNGYESASDWIEELVQVPSAFPDPKTEPRQHIWLVAGVVVFFAVFTPFTEFIFPQRYTSTFNKQLEEQAGFLPEAGETVIYGRATYPRYYFPGEGELTAKLGYKAGEEPRLVFFVVGSSNGLVVFHLEDAPKFFPHTSDVYMVGIWDEQGYFSPRSVFVLKDGQSAIYQSP
jgi:hypothetical protein